MRSLTKNKCIEIEEYLYEAFLNKETLNENILLHLEDCSSCSQMLAELQELDKELTPLKEEIATPPLWYFAKLIETNQKDRKLTFKESFLFLSLGFAVVAIAYIGISRDMFFQITMLSSLISFILIISAILSGKESRG